MPANNQDYFTNVRQRQTGVPLAVNLPKIIESEKSMRAPQSDPMQMTMDSLNVYKEVIPSFLPNDKLYKKFGNVI